MFAFRGSWVARRHTSCSSLRPPTPPGPSHVTLHPEMETAKCVCVWCVRRVAARKRQRSRRCVRLGSLSEQPPSVGIRSRSLFAVEAKTDNTLEHGHSVSLVGSCQSAKSQQRSALSALRNECKGGSQRQNTFMGVDSAVVCLSVVLSISTRMNVIWRCELPLTTMFRVQR